jgi:hypothetical protein
VPDPTTIDRVQSRRIMRLVAQRLEACGSAAFKIEEELDNEIADLYGLSPDERKAVGMNNDLRN